MSGPNAHDWLSKVEPYVAGRANLAGGGKVIKLSANESCLGPSPKAIAALGEQAGTLQVYPLGDYTPLRELLARQNGIDADRIMIGNGSDELLNLIGRAFAGPGDEILFCRHSFMMYPIVAQRVGATPVVAADKNYVGDVAAILGAVTDRTRVIFLANPNNPTGTYLSAGDLERLHAGLKDDVVLVIDAAYAEFADADDFSDGLPLVDRAANIMVTRTFSKIYGLAALRVGWAYMSPVIMDALARLRDPFNVSSIAHAVALAAAADEEYTAAARVHNSFWRGEMAAGLAALGLTVVPSQTNFLLIEFPDDPAFCAEAADTYLSERGILLRWLPKQGLANCLRLTIGTEQDNHAVLTELRAFMNRGNAA